ncbi:MAG: tetratricopeptide repeat protein, partial [Persicimonas sp.]
SGGHRPIAKLRSPDKAGARHIDSESVTYLFLHNLRRTKARATLLIAVLALVVGCARKEKERVYAWEEDLIEADLEQDRENLEAAEDSYQSLLESAPDQERRREITNELGRLDEKRERFEEALEHYEEVWSEDEFADEQGGRALYRTALIHLREFDDAERGVSLFERTIDRYPESIYAEFALERLADHHAERGQFDTLEESFMSMYDDHSEELVAANILFELAETLADEADDPDAALPYYRRVHQDHDTLIGLSDDALWEEARIYHRRQMWDEAIPLYEELSEKQQPSWFIGSYDSYLADDARLELGRIHMLFLDDYETAIEHFEQYLKDFPDTVLVDDAAWHIVQAHRLMGDTDGYKEQLEAFAEDYPESRYQRQIDTLLEAEASR